MTEIATQEAAPVAVYNPNPTGSELDALMRQAELIGRSQIVPKSYQGKPADLLAAALMGRSFGWDLISSTRFVQVIQGTATIKPEAMLALIRSRGHSVTIERTKDGVTVTGTRADTGDTDTVTFTLADAERAGLIRNPTWKQYPIDMCQWRAISRLARSLFADVTLGAAYTPEEIALAKAEPNVVVELDGDITPVDERDWDGLLDSCETADAARQLYKEAAAAKAPQSILDAIITKGKELAETEDVVEAELLEEERDAVSEVLDSAAVYEGSEWDIPE